MNAEQNLKNLAKKHGIYIGAAVAADHLSQDEQYRDLITREFNIITPENAMKFWATRPNRDQYDFKDADALISFSDTNRLKVRGHTLVWHKSLPKWLTDGNFTKGEIQSILREHIKTITERYRGKIFAWDVINEPINHNGKLEDSLWLETLGLEYIELALRWTHESDPNAKLFINEWGAETINKKSNALYKMVKELLQRNVPIHGVGLQMHIAIGDSDMAEDVPQPEDFKANMKRFSDLGMKVHITEMDVQIHGLKKSDDEKLRAQAQVYADIVKSTLSIPNFEALVLWGVIDKYSWIPEFIGQPDAPLIFDDFYLPKPAYESIVNVLSTTRLGV